MESIASGARRAFVSALALTRTTEWAARRLGTARFLPALFVDRFTHLGGIVPAVFAAQLAECRSFEDSRWATYWKSFAGEYLATADGALVFLRTHVADAPIQPIALQRIGI
jgi:esterase FrsA